ncbi:TPA: helix-turn-helix domain-containing protein [Salmonella enterica subsp. enterica serovar Java]
MNINIPQPEEVKRLRLKANMTQKQMSELFNMSLSSWQRKEISASSKNYRPINSGEYITLLLLAGEHPEYVLCKRDK